jgi:hypothetical protein
MSEYAYDISRQPINNPVLYMVVIHLISIALELKMF